MNTRSLAVAALAAALLGVGSMVHTDQPPATHVQIVQAAGNRMSTAQVAESADHVLVADVVRLLGTDTGSGLPRTRFEVTVLGNLFGILPTTVDPDHRRRAAGDPRRRQPPSRRHPPMGATAGCPDDAHGPVQPVVGLASRGNG